MGIYIGDAFFHTLLLCMYAMFTKCENRRENDGDDCSKCSDETQCATLLVDVNSRSPSKTRPQCIGVNYCVCVCVTEIKRADPPVFTEPLQDCCVDEGSDVVLQGSVTGSQPIKVSWLHNGEQKQFRLQVKMFLWF